MVTRTPKVCKWVSKMPNIIKQIEYTFILNLKQKTISELLRWWIQLNYIIYKLFPSYFVCKINKNKFNL